MSAKTKMMNAANADQIARKWKEEFGPYMKRIEVAFLQLEAEIDGLQGEVSEFAEGLTREDDAPHRLRASCVADDLFEAYEWLENEVSPILSGVRDLIDLSTTDEELEAEAVVAA